VCNCSSGMADRCTSDRSCQYTQSSRQTVASSCAQQSSSGATGQAINRAFLVAGPKTWNALSEDLASSQSEYIFLRQLKTWFFKKSFPGIVIWYWLHLDFYLRLVCSNFEAVLSFKVYDMVWFDDGALGFLWRGPPQQIPTTARWVAIWDQFLMQKSLVAKVFASVGITTLLALSVYQIIVNNTLPTTSDAIPLLG